MTPIVGQFFLNWNIPDAVLARWLENKVAVTSN